MELNDLSTEFIGKNFIHLESIDSTQIYIKHLDKNNKAENGTVVYSDIQTGGIGTHLRKWYTGMGENLAFSLVLYPNCKINEFERFTFILAETILETIKVLYNKNLQIKIPNDIIYSGKKMGGILTESVSQGEIVKKIFIGIGFNVNQSKFPGNLSEIATSMKIEFGGEYDREKILKKFLELFEEKYLRMLSEVVRGTENLTTFD